MYMYGVAIDKNCIDTDQIIIFALMFLPCINNVNITNPSKFVTGKDWDHARLAQSCTILMWCISAICRAHVVQSFLTEHSHYWLKNKVLP